MTRLTVMLGLCCGTLLWSRGAAADQPLCSKLSAPPIYISGSSALEPMLKAIGKVLASQADASKRFSLVYVKDGSCEGVRKFVPSGVPAQTTTIPQNAQPYYIDGSYDSTKAPPQCLLSDQPSTGVAADLGISDVFVEVCTGQQRPADVSDLLGPAQAMLFITHPNSTQTAISAEEAYLAFGLGADGAATPWVDPQYFFIRPDSSGTKNMLAAAIKVPVAKWKGIFAENGKSFGSNEVRDHVAAQAANAEKTIGILGADVYDDARGSVKALAFRGFGQKHAYWPDSTPTSFDKRNVRDGHYLGFGYAHLVARLENGQVANPKAKLLVDVLTQAQDVSDTLSRTQVITILSKTAHLIPQCAMKVQRTKEGGELSKVDAPEPCHCLFDSLFSTGTPAGCTACGDDKGCTAGKCRHGFCEAR
jgi:hypothetical protein